MKILANHYMQVSKADIGKGNVSTQWYLFLGKI